MPSDVTLKVDGTTFSCLRSALAVESPYFEAMFSNNFAERNKTVIEIQVKPIHLIVACKLKKLNVKSCIQNLCNPMFLFASKI